MVGEAVVLGAAVVVWAAVVVIVVVGAADVVVGATVVVVGAAVVVAELPNSNIENWKQSLILKYCENAFLPSSVMHVVP